MVAPQQRRRVIHAQLAIPAHRVIGLFERGGFVHGDEVVGTGTINHHLLHQRTGAKFELSNGRFGLKEPVLIIGVVENIGGSEAAGLAVVAIRH